MRTKDRIRTRMKQQRADYYLATAVSTTKVTTGPPENNFEAKRLRMRQQRDSLKDYYLATAVSTTKVKTNSPNNNFETKNEKMVAQAEAPAPAPSTTFAQEISRFWCTAFGDTETKSTSYGCFSSNNTICSGAKDDSSSSSSSDNRNPDDRNPTTKKKSSDFGRRDDFRNLHTMTSPPKRIEDANSLLTGNESHEITSHPASLPHSNDDVNSRNWEKESFNSTIALADESTIDDESTIGSIKCTTSKKRSSRIESPPPLDRKSRSQPRLQSLREDTSLIEPTSTNNDDDDINRFLQYIESIDDDIKRKEEMKIANILSHDCVDFNSRDDCNSTILSNGASTILTFDEANHYHRHQRSPRFINCCSVSDALPGLPCVEGEEERGGGGNVNASTDPTGPHESFDDALSTVVLKPVVDYVKISPPSMMKRDLIPKVLPAIVQNDTDGDGNGDNDRHHVTASGVDNVHNGGDAKPNEDSTKSRRSKQSEGSIKSRHSVAGSLILDKLRKYLPYDFQLTYSLTRHGSDLQTVLEKTKSCIFTTLLVVETIDGEAFGVFTAKPWNVTRKFHSGPESFLWRLGSTTGDDADGFELYPFAGKSPDVHFCNMDRVAAAVKMISRQGGGGNDSSSKSSQLEMTEWGFGLSFQWDLRLGTSTASEKFNSPSLSEKQRFVVKNIEFYTIAP